MNVSVITNAFLDAPFIWFALTNEPSSESLTELRFIETNKKFNAYLQANNLAINTTFNEQFAVWGKKEYKTINEACHHCLFTKEPTNIKFLFLKTIGFAEIHLTYYNNIISVYIHHTENAFGNFFNNTENILNVKELQCICDYEGNFLDCNNSIIEVLGYGKEEFLENPIPFYLHPDDFETTFEAIKLLNANRPQAKLVNRFRKKDGSYCKLEWFAAANNNYVFSTARDITETAVTLNTYEKQNQQLKSLVNILQKNFTDTQGFLDYALDELIAITCSDIGYIYFYDEKTALFTLNTWSKKVMPNCGIINPQSVYCLADTGFWGEAVRQRKPVVNNQFALKHPLKKGYPEGHVIIEKFLSIPIFFDNHIVAVAGVANKKTDYTENDVLQMTLLMNSVWKTTKQMQGVQQLKESEEKWRSIINTSPDVISVCNLDGIVTAVSEKGIEKWDFQSADEVIGKKIFEFLHPSSREKAMYFVNELLNGHFTGPAEYIMQRKDGSTFLAEVNGEMIYDLNGKPKEMIFVTRDITERKKAEEAIIKSENKLRFITENTNDVIWVLDPFTQKFTYVSPSVYHLRGFTDEEVMQQKVTEAVLPETVKQVEQDIRNDIAHFLSDPQKQPFTRKVENLQPHKNGSIIETESTTTVCFNNEGNIEIVGVTRDVTERKKLERALKESNNFLENLLNYANAPIIVWDENFLITRFNHAFERLTGLKEVAVLNKPVSILFPEMQKEASIELIDKTITGERWNSVEIDIVDVDGNVHTLLWNSATLFDEGEHTPIATIAQGQDITLRKLIELELKESEDKFATIFKLSPYIIILSQIETCTIIDVNDAFTQVLGFSRTEAIGKTTIELNIWESLDKRQELIKQLFEGNKVEAETIIFFDKKKQKHNGSYTGKFIRWRNERYLLSIVNDITELEEKNKALEELNKDKDRLFSIIGHDLKGPINNFLGLTEIMATDIGSFTLDEIGEIANKMRKSVKSVSQLLENLLQWARLKQGRLPFNPTPLAVQQLITSSITSLKEISRNKNIQINYKANNYTTILADSDIVQTIIRNLLSNALKFTPKGGTVTITEKVQNNQWLELAIHDNGIGMTEDILEHLFKIDAKKGRPGTEGEPSSGLGLLLCAELVEKHGGKIWANSKINEGSSFYFTLPITSS